MLRAILIVVMAVPVFAQVDEGDALFRKHVAPMLVTKCAGCHGAQRISGFNVSSREALLKGGTRGSALVPGSARDSLLLAVIDRTHAIKMPPGATLPDETIAAVRRWIELGARWANDAAPTPPANLDEDRWAFQPVKHITPPAATNRRAAMQTC